ncbi:MAG: hypothetical protein KAJ51_15695 [Thermoplasmata archaeon]|nr:hypothetical protein [Thermoplasmata archaeon]
MSNDWPFEVTVISRQISNSWYIFMLILMIIAIILAYYFRLKRFSAFLWLFSGIIGLVWESILFVTGVRTYTFSPVLELLYHALTEAGPGLIIMVIFAWKVGIIDLTEFKDENLKKSKTEKESEPEEL